MEIAFKLSVNGIAIEKNLAEIYNEFIPAIAVDKLVELTDQIIQKGLLKVVPTSFSEFVLVVNLSTGEVPDYVILMVYANEGAYFPDIVVNGRGHKRHMLELKYAGSGPTKRSRKNLCRNIILEISQRGCSGVADMMELAYKLASLDALPDVAYETEVGEQQAESQDCAIDCDGNSVSAEQYAFDVEGFKEALPSCRSENFYSLVADFVKPVDLFRKKFKGVGNGLYHSKLGEVFAQSGLFAAGITQLYLVDESPEDEPVAIDLDEFAEFIAKGMSM